MTKSPDPRRTPWRADLAAVGLEGTVPSPRFVEGTLRQVRHGVASLKTAPADSAEQASQVLYGEHFIVYDEAAGWAWGQNRTDGYVGYLRTAALDASVTEPNYRVAVLRTFVYPYSDIKVPPRDVLSLTSPVTVNAMRDGWAELSVGGWVIAKHLSPMNRVEPDIIATARRLLGIPYLWGGRTSLGLDCSALVQIALAAAGIAAPRDSDMQREEVGASLGPVPADGIGVAFQAGDMVFFPGHVAIMIDPERVIHATAHGMTVAIEPLTDVIARTDPTRGGGLLAVRRL